MDPIAAEIHIFKQTIGKQSADDLLQTLICDRGREVKGILDFREMQAFEPNGLI